MIAAVPHPTAGVTIVGTDAHGKSVNVPLNVPPSLEPVPVLRTWLTPAPEPEPDEPTAYGALVRDGDGRLWIHNPVEYAQGSPEWDAEDRLSTRWANIPRPITVVLADPAEVETLRAEVESLTGLLHAARGKLQEVLGD